MKQARLQSFAGNIHVRCYQTSKSRQESDLSRRFPLALRIRYSFFLWRQNKYLQVLNSPVLPWHVLDTPGLLKPISAGLEGALDHGRKAVMMDIHGAWGKAFWGQPLIPTQFHPVTAELLLYPKRLRTALPSDNISPPTLFKWDMNNWLASWIINWIFNNESNCLAHSPIDNQANLFLQYAVHTGM